MTETNPPRPRGRPSGTTKPPEKNKTAIIRVRVTTAERDKFDQVGGAVWLRHKLARARP